MIQSLVASNTFEVSEVALATTPLRKWPYPKAVASFLSGPIEACSKYDGELVAQVGNNPLIAAMHLAYGKHYPLVLSPDILWLTITQGLAQHIKLNAQSLRHKFVSHQGKLSIVVRRDGFVKGSPDNPWPEVFAEFSERIREHIGDAHDLIVADFSTTGPVERAASEIVLLDAMQSYFDYDFVSICGIPSITLEGTVDDWESIATRAQALAQYDLDWWIEPLMPILLQFVNAADGRVDGAFWASMYKDNKRPCSDPFISGWVMKLFPYLFGFNRSLVRNEWLEVESPRSGPERKDFPNTPSVAPFQWKLVDSAFAMEFIGGLLGVAQCNSTLAVRPEIGWVIRDTKPANKAPGGASDWQRLCPESMI
jgi:hypothetical protein